MGEVHESGLVPDDVRVEQRKLEAAELLVFQFPLWWYGAPAILKGWFDRVFTNGFAYGGVDAETGLPLRYGEGGLKGKRALIIVTAGEDARSIGTRGISGDIDALLFPITHGTLWYTGIESLDLHVIHDADALDAAAVASGARPADHPARGHPRRGAVSAVPRLHDGEYRGTRALRADILPGRTDLDIHRVDARASRTAPARRARRSARAGSDPSGDTLAGMGFSVLGLALSLASSLRACRSSGSRPALRCRPGWSLVR